MIEIVNVSKSFGNKKVLDQISIQIKEGTIYGLIGENGAGKTTLLQCLMGVYCTDEGSILFDGEEIYENNKMKQHIAYVADRNYFFKDYTVEKMLAFFKMTYPDFDETLYEKYNKVFNLQGKTKVKNLSKGMQMRLSVMLALASRPKVVLMDEPTSGLDPLAKKQVLDFIIEAAAENKTTVIISSHHLGELERVCDEVTMIAEGKAVYQSSVDDLKNQVKKIQVVFEKEVPKDLETWQGVLNVSHIGSVYYVVTNQYSKSFEDKLKGTGVKLMEIIGLNLEEVFIYTADKKQKERRQENEKIEAAH